MAPSREVPSQICAVLGQKQPFFAQNGPSTGSKQPNEGKRLLHSTCGLTFSRPRDLWCPLTPRYVRETAQKGTKKAPKTAQCAPAPRNQERAVSWATWLQNEFRGHLVHPQPPTFYGFQASESPKETRRPPVPVVTWCSRRAGQPTHSGGQRWVHQGPQGEKKIFSKVVPRPLGMLKQVFLGRLDPVATGFGSWKIQKCLENGPFWDRKWVKNGSKRRFSKSDPGPFGMLKQVFLAHFEPVVTRFGSWKLQKCLENGPFWD